MGLGLGACTVDTTTTAWVFGDTEPLPGAECVAAGDLDADGTESLAICRGTTLHFPDNNLSFDILDSGSVQVLTAWPAHHSLVVAKGQGRGHRDAAIEVLEVREGGAESLWKRDGERDQVTDVRPIGDRLWVAAYSDAKTVSGGWLEAGDLQAGVSAHMGQRQLPLNDGSVVVGRVYGPAPRSPGDLQLHGPGGAKPLHSLRGVRALAAADLDGDGVAEVISGDGWHYAYGKEADPRIVLHDGPDLASSRTIGWIPDSYAALDIVPIGTDDPTTAALVVHGSHRVVLLHRDPLGWAATVLAEVEETAHVAVAHRPGGADVAWSGKGAGRVRVTRESR